MKTIQTILFCGVAVCVAPFINAQEVIRETVPAAGGAVVEAETTTPIVGTVTTFDNAGIAIRTGTSAHPLQYRFSKSTQWVDEAGNVITRETVRTGAPVTVYYSKVADGMVASKVVVRRTTTNVPAEPPGVGPGPDTVVTTQTTQPLEIVGTLTTFGDGAISLRTEESTTPIQYHYSDTTQWMDENGRVVTREHVRAGTPVTVFYTRGETGLIVSKVVVRRTATAAVVEERPVRKVERRPAPIAAGPKAVEKETTVIQKPAPAIVEKHTTTTTTTTTPKKKVKKDDDDDDDDDDKD